MSVKLDKYPTKSDRITSADCLGCGVCCEKYEIFYPTGDGSWEAEVQRSEMQRLQMLAGFGDKLTTREGVGGTWLIFNIPCRFLQSDKRCAIYGSQNRPLLCRCFPYVNSTQDDCPHIRPNPA